VDSRQSEMLSPVFAEFSLPGLKVDSRQSAAHGALQLDGSFLLSPSIW